MLTLAVITLDEEDRIGGCLCSVPFADERLVLDSGSRDRTVCRAREAGARVVRTDWPGFGTQKNRALDLAAHGWVLFLDADERLSATAARELEALLRAPGSCCGASFPILTHWLGRPLRHGRAYPNRRNRLVWKGRGRWSEDVVHERLEVHGPVRALAGDIVHEPYRSLGEHLRTANAYAHLGARELERRGVRAHLWDLALRPPLHFTDALLLRRGFLDGLPGLAVAGVGAGHVLLKWGRRWLDSSP